MFILKRNDGITKEKKGYKGKKNVKLIFYCLIATTAIYAMLIATEKAIIKQEAQKAVYVAIKDIPEMIFVTEENFEEYFALENRALSALPSEPITESKQVLNCFVTNTIYENQILIEEMFKSEKNIVDAIENPIEISFTAGSIAQTVGGVLRAGDLINIWSVRTVSENGAKKTLAELIYEGAYISRAFTSSGDEVKRGSGDED